MLKFEKYEGLGNDFIIPHLTDAKRWPEGEQLLELSESECAKWSQLCDRRRSIGADGVLIHSVSGDGKHVMTIVNQDGSIAEMCGNGLRCMALYLHRRTHQKTHHFEIMTLAGKMKATILADGVRCEIGAATLKGKLTIHSDGHQFDGYQLSTGNPHFVIFDPVHDNLRKKCAASLSSHAEFQAGVNVSFARIITQSHIQLDVFERGCGWTQACGTAATATVAAYWHAHGCEGKPITVQLPGGSLLISGKYNEMVMQGPSKFLFEGHIDFQSSVFT